MDKHCFPLPYKSCAQLQSGMSGHVSDAHLLLSIGFPHQKMEICASKQLGFEFKSSEQWESSFVFILKIYFFKKLLRCLLWVKWLWPEPPPKLVFYDFRLSNWLCKNLSKKSLLNVFSFNKGMHALISLF